MTIDMWFILIMSVFLGIFIGLIIYSVDNKVAFREAVVIKFLELKYSLKNILRRNK